MIRMSDLIMVAPAIFLGLFGWGYSQFIIRSNRRNDAVRARAAAEQARTSAIP